MWTRIQMCAVTVLYAVTILLPPSADACDDREQNAQQREQEFAQKVERYNQLLRQEQFHEAIVLGKEARLMQPENPMGEVMVYKGILARQDVINKLSVRFKATLAADVPEDTGDSDEIRDTLRIADATIHRLVSGKDTDAADCRRLLDASLERRIEAVDEVCRLTDAQKRKLRLAGQGDIKRFSDRVEAIRLRDDDRPDQQLCGNAFLGAGRAARPPRKLGLFEQGSLFTKTLKTSLLEGQAAAFEEAQSNAP